MSGKLSSRIAFGAILILVLLRMPGSLVLSEGVLPPSEDVLLEGETILKEDRETSFMYTRLDRTLMLTSLGSIRQWTAPHANTGDHFNLDTWGVCYKVGSDPSVYVDCHTGSPVEQSYNRTWITPNVLKATVKQGQDSG